MNQIRRDNKQAALAITIAAIIFIFTLSFAFTLINVNVNDIITEFSLDGTSQGLMSSMLSVGVMLALIVAPLIQGRVSKIAMMVAAGVLQAVALVACGASNTFYLYCMSCVLLGIGSSFVDAYANSSVVDVWKEESPKYFGYLHGFFGIGSLIAPIILYRLTFSIGWRGVYYLLAVLMVIAVAVVILLTRKVGQGDVAAVTHEQTFTLADLTEYLRRRRNVMLLITGMAAVACQGGLLVWIVRYMTLRFDAAALGAVSISLFWVCATINRFCIARIGIDPMKLLIGGGVGCGISLAIGTISANPVVMCVMMAVAGLCSGHFVPVLFSECSSGYEGKTTFTTSLIMFVMGIVRILIPLVMAYVSVYVSVFTGMMIPAVSSILMAFFGFLAFKSK